MSGAYYLSELLERQVKDSWKNEKTPDASTLCSSESSDLTDDSLVLSKWLTGKTANELEFDEVAENFMPFFYLGETAAVYYLGGYLLASLKLMRKDLDELRDSFSFDHMLDYIGSIRFSVVFEGFESEKKKSLLAFIELILEVIHAPTESEEILDKIRLFYIKNKNY